MAHVLRIAIVSGITPLWLASQLLAQPRQACSRTWMTKFSAMRSSFTTSRLIVTN